MDNREQMYIDALANGTIPPEPITRIEHYLASMCGMEVELPTPITRREVFFAYAAGMEIDIPEPITREEWYLAQWRNQPSEVTLHGTMPITLRNAVKGNLSGLVQYGKVVRKKPPVLFSASTRFSLSVCAHFDGELEGSTDGITWTTIEEYHGGYPAVIVSGYNNVTQKHEIYVRGRNNTYIRGEDYSGLTARGAADIRCDGNIETLLDYTVVERGEHPRMAEECFYQLFSHSNIITAPELPATNLTPQCYEGLFQYCDYLTEAPDLPATVMAERCYAYMFWHCPSLHLPARLPSNIVPAIYCFTGMYNPSGITKANKLTFAAGTNDDDIAHAVYQMYCNTDLHVSAAPLEGYDYSYSIPYNTNTGSTTETAVFSAFDDMTLYTEYHSTFDAIDPLEESNLPEYWELHSNQGKIPHDSSVAHEWITYGEISWYLYKAYLATDAVADEKDMITGTITRRCNYKVFDGTEDWTRVALATGNQFKYSVSAPSAQSPTISTHFDNAPDGATIYTQPNNSCWCGNTGLRIRCDAFSTKEEWKAYLAAQYAAGTPLIVIWQRYSETTEDGGSFHPKLEKGDNVINCVVEIDGIEFDVTYTKGAYE